MSKFVTFSSSQNLFYYSTFVRVLCMFCKYIGSFRLNTEFTEDSFVHGLHCFDGLGYIKLNCSKRTQLPKPEVACDFGLITHADRVRWRGYDVRICLSICLSGA